MAFEFGSVSIRFVADTTELDSVIRNGPPGLQQMRDIAVAAKLDPRQINREIASVATRIDCLPVGICIDSEGARRQVRELSREINAEIGRIETNINTTIQATIDATNFERALDRTFSNFESRASDIGDEIADRVSRARVGVRQSGGGLGGLLTAPFRGISTGIFEGLGIDAARRLGEGLFPRLENRFRRTFQSLGADIEQQFFGIAQRFGDQVANNLGARDGLADIRREVVDTSRFIENALEDSLDRASRTTARLIRGNLDGLKEEISGITRDIVGIGARLATVPVRARNATFAQEGAQRAQEIAQDIEINPSEAMVNARSITIAVGGLTGQPGGIENTSFTAAALSQLLPETFVTSVPNAQQNDFGGDLAESVLQFVRDLGVTAPEGVDFDKNGEDQLPSIVNRVVKLFESAVLEGFDPDAISIAARALAIREVLPDTPLNLVGLSGGGQPVAGAIDLLERLGIDDVRGVGLLTPMTGFARPQSRENFQSIIGTEDPFSQGFFGTGSDGNQVPPVGRGIFQQVEGGGLTFEGGTTHSPLEFANSEEAREFFFRFLNEVGPSEAKNFAKGVFGFLLKTRGFEGLQLEGSLRGAFGQETEGFDFFSGGDTQFGSLDALDFFLRRSSVKGSGIVSRLPETARKFGTTEDLQQELTDFAQFLETFERELLDFIASGQRALPLESLQRATEFFSDLEGLAAEQITPQAQAQRRAIVESEEFAARRQTIGLERELFGGSSQSIAATIQRLLGADPGQFEFTFDQGNVGGFIDFANGLIEQIRGFDPRRADELLEFFNSFNDALNAQARGEGLSARNRETLLSGAQSALGISRERIEGGDPITSLFQVPEQLDALVFRTDLFEQFLQFNDELEAAGKRRIDFFRAIVRETDQGISFEEGPGAFLPEVAPRGARLSERRRFEANEAARQADELLTIQNVTQSGGLQTTLERSQQAILERLNQNVASQIEEVFENVDAEVVTGNARNFVVGLAERLIEISIRTAQAAVERNFEQNTSPEALNQIQAGLDRINEGGLINRIRGQGQVDIAVTQEALRRSQQIFQPVRGAIAGGAQFAGGVAGDIFGQLSQLSPNNRALPPSGPGGALIRTAQTGIRLFARASDTLLRAGLALESAGFALDPFGVPGALKGPLQRIGRNVALPAATFAAAEAFVPGVGPAVSGIAGFVGQTGANAALALQGGAASQLPGAATIGNALASAGDIPIVGGQLANLGGQIGEGVIAVQEFIISRALSDLASLGITIGGGRAALGAAQQLVFPDRGERQPQLEPAGVVIEDVEPIAQVEGSRRAIVEVREQLQIAAQSSEKIASDFAVIQRLADRLAVSNLRNLTPDELVENARELRAVFTQFTNEFRGVDASTSNLAGAAAGLLELVTASTSAVEQLRALNEEIRNNNELLERFGTSTTRAIGQQQGIISSRRTSALGILEEIAPELRNLAQFGEGAGRDLALGVIRGIEQSLDAVGASSTELAREIIQRIREELEIASPSKKAIEAGREIGRGLGIGIKEGGRAALRAASELTDAIAEGLREPLQFGRGLFQGLADSIPILGQAGRILRDLTIGAAALFGVFSAGDAILEGIRSSFRVFLELEQVQNTLVAVTGSVAESNIVLQDFIETTQDLSIRLRASTTQFSQFLAATRGSDEISIETASDSFVRISTALNGIATDSQTAGRAYTALTQIVSKGVVQQEELRQQLGEALPGALATAARAFGLTTREFNELVRAGEITAGQFLPRFAEQVEVELGGAADAARNSIIGLTNDFDNLIFLTQQRIGAGLADIAVPILRVVNPALELLIENAGLVGSALTTVVFTAVLRVADSFGLLEKAANAAFGAIRRGGELAISAGRGIRSIPGQVRGAFDASATRQFQSRETDLLEARNRQQSIRQSGLSRAQTGIPFGDGERRFFDRNEKGLEATQRQLRTLRLEAEKAGTATTVLGARLRGVGRLGRAAFTPLVAGIRAAGTAILGFTTALVKLAIPFLVIETGFRLFEAFTAQAEDARGAVNGLNREIERFNRIRGQRVDGGLSELTSELPELEQQLNRAEAVARQIPVLGNLIGGVFFGGFAAVRRTVDTADRLDDILAGATQVGRNVDDTFNRINSGEAIPLSELEALINVQRAFEQTLENFPAANQQQQSAIDNRLDSLSRELRINERNLEILEESAGFIDIANRRRQEGQLRQERSFQALRNVAQGRTRESDLGILNAQADFAQTIGNLETTASLVQSRRENIDQTRLEGRLGIAQFNAISALQGRAPNAIERAQRDRAQAQLDSIEDLETEFVETEKQFFDERNQALEQFIAFRGQLLDSEISDIDEAATRRQAIFDLVRSQENAQDAAALRGGIITQEQVRQRDVLRDIANQEAQVDSLNTQLELLLNIRRRLEEGQGGFGLTDEQRRALEFQGLVPQDLDNLDRLDDEIRNRTIQRNDALADIDRQYFDERRRLIEEDLRQYAEAQEIVVQAARNSADSQIRELERVSSGLENQISLLDIQQTELDSIRSLSEAVNGAITGDLDRTQADLEEAQRLLENVGEGGEVDGERIRRLTGRRGTDLEDIEERLRDLTQERIEAQADALEREITLSRDLLNIEIQRTELAQQRDIAQSQVGVANAAVGVAQARADLAGGQRDVALAETPGERQLAQLQVDALQGVLDASLDAQQASRNQLAVEQSRLGNLDAISERRRLAESIRANSQVEEFGSSFRGLDRDGQRLLDDRLSRLQELAPGPNLEGIAERLDRDLARIDTRDVVTAGDKEVSDTVKQAAQDIIDAIQTSRPPTTVSVNPSQLGGDIVNLGQSLRGG